MPYSKRSHSFVLLIVISSLFLFPGLTESAEDDGSFSVIVLPDTQFYSETYHDTYTAQTRWIRDNVESQNIQMVIHLGDIVQNDRERKEWEVARGAHRLLDDAVPYSVLPGNHDMAAASRDSTLYNEYFPVSDFDDNEWYGGHYGDTNDNNFVYFNSDGLQFMVLNLEYAPRDEVLEWANGVVEKHKDRRVIVATHRYMRPAGRDDIGEAVWNKLVRKHNNIFMVICGHVGALTLQNSPNDHGGTVYEMLVDYQSMNDGGQGWLRILRFKPKENVISVEEYSPLLDQSRRQIYHNYRLYHDMTTDN